MSTNLTVSDLANLVGVSPDAVRYYERLGLRLREIAELLEVVDRGQRPLWPHREAAERAAGCGRRRACSPRGAAGPAGPALAQAPSRAARRTRPRGWWWWWWWCVQAGIPGPGEVTVMAACPNCGCPCGERPCPCVGGRPERAKHHVEPSTYGLPAVLLVRALEWGRPGRVRQPQRSMQARGSRRRSASHRC